MNPSDFPISMDWNCLVLFTRNPQAKRYEMLGRLLAYPFDQFVKILNKSWELRDIVDNNASINVFKNRNLFSKFLHATSSDDLDWYYSALKRKLTNDIKWRYGHKRTNDVAMTVLKSFLKYSNTISGTYCEIGCGVANPFGTSAVMFLHGAKETRCFDKEAIDETRVSEALFDLLANCFFFEENWLAAAQFAPIFRHNLSMFNMPSLASGNLSEGLGDAPLRFFPNVFSKMAIEDASLNYLSSWVVLEHIVDLPGALREMFNWLSPNGLAFHHIDLRDHRYYSNPAHYNQWSFLTEAQPTTPSEDAYFLNELRASDFKSVFEETGYEILEWQEFTEQPPSNIRLRLHNRFEHLSDNDLSTTAISCLLRRTVYS